MSSQQLNNNIYGAFELKRIYPKNYLTGVGAAILLHLFVMIALLIFIPAADEEELRSVRIKIIPYNELGPPPSIMEKETPAANLISEKPVFGNPVAAKKGEPVSEFKMPDESSGAVGDVKVEEPKAEPKIEPKVEAPYLVSVDMMPEPYGGTKAIQGLLIYPKTAINEQVEGKVFVKAFVNDQGSVTRAEIVKGIGYGCDEEAVRVVRMTSFRPGKLNGRYVNVQITIPVLFSLNN